jgi:uncharacterized membrane protein
MITLGTVYVIAGLMFGGYALLCAADRRWGNAAFWGLLAVAFLAGDHLGDVGNGCLVLALVAIAGLGGLRRGAQDDDGAGRAASAARLGNRIFLPALIIPVTALVGTLTLKHFPALVDPRQVTLISLAAGVLIALAVCQWWLKPAPAAPLREGLRLMDSVGWAAILPQLLASLGAIFALSGVGGVVGGLFGRAIPAGSLLGAVMAYGLGMAVFTMVMGNAFAAFPVMAAAVGIPLLIHQYGGDPAVIAAIGMLCGFCGTLMTPMAANFNIVPAALLDLKDRNGVIRQQVGTALPLLAINIALIYWLAFP